MPSTFNLSSLIVPQKIVYNNEDTVFTWIRQWVKFLKFDWNKIMSMFSKVNLIFIFPQIWTYNLSGFLWFPTWRIVFNFSASGCPLANKHKLQRQLLASLDCQDSDLAKSLKMDGIV